MPRRVGRSRRRRRSDQHRLNTSDSSSFLEISHDNGHAHSHEHCHHEHDHYPHDGIHNIDHHHVHVQDQQLHTPPHNHTPKQINFQVHDPLYKQPQVHFEGLQRESYQAAYLSSLEVHSRNRANRLFEELQKEEEPRLRALKKMAKERTVTTNESTTTTVRRTLIDPSTNGGPQVGGINGGVSGIAESVKNTVSGFLTPSKEKTYAAIVESSESGVEDGIIIGDRKGVYTPDERFVPAREFFSERDTRERLSSDYFSGSDTPTRLKESTRRLSIRKPYNDYIAYSSDEEYDDWKQQPKSDYTYSASLTYRKRVTPDRKIGSPNMSRRTLKGGNITYAGTADFSASEEGSNALDLRSRTIFKPMDALSDTSDGEESVEQHFQRRSRKSSRSRSMDIPKINGSLTRSLTTTSSSYTTTRTLHRGLDTESDVDDGTESTVPLRATPLAARSGTPLGRASTPLGIFNSASRRSSNRLDTVGRGYTLGEGTIAEDVEEEDETQGSTIVRWSRKTWLTITHVTTIITASIAMAAASALTAASSSSKHSSSSTNSSFFSIVKNTRTSIVTTVSENYNAACERLRKNPVLIWIPLLFILLLLGLVAYWWLMQSSGKTAGATDPTENDRPSFFLLLLTLVSDFTSWIYSSISSFLASAWVTTTGTCTWLVSSCYEGLVYAWVSTVGMFTWLWSLTLTCLAFLLQMFYVAVEYLQYGALGVLSFFTSSASYLYGFLPFATYNDTVDNNSNLKNDSWSLITWVSNISPLERLSETYVSVSGGVQSSGTVVWNGWLWLVLSMGEILSAMGAYTVWLLSSIWSAFVYLVTGLWTFLTYLFLTLIGFLTMTASTVSSVASNASSAVVTGTSMYVMPLFRSSEKVVNKPLVVNTPTPNIKTVEHLVQQTMNFKDGTVEEIVRQVLDSEELKGLIAAAVAESSKEHLTIDAVSGIAKSVVERELGLLKEETSALKSEIQTNAAATAEHQSKILHLREEKAYLINELEMLGQRLYNVEGKIEVADQRSIEDRQQNEEQIEQLIQQINKLEVDHNNLAVDVKSCCDDKKVPAILGEIFGLTVNGTADETSDGKEPLSAGDIGAWLKSYFVAKDELESRLNTLMTTMQVKTDIDENEKSAVASSLTQAAVAQTTQIVMNSVLEKLREEMAKQQHQFSEESQQQVSEQVNLQVKAAAGILGQQVLEQVQMQKQHLSETLKVNVDSAVQDAVTSALPNAVDSAVAGAVEASVDIAVEKAVSSSVNVAVENAIDIAVPAAVNEAVSVVVEKVVPEAVAEVLPNAVSEQIAIAVPEVVASVLPAAVSTAVNETVTSAVSEAMVHVSVNKAGDQTIQVNQNRVKNEIVGVVGTTSANASYESNSNLFVPGMHLSGLNESAVIQIVKDALKKYDADKTGMVDHALETAGGNIISTRCTESYQVHQAEVRVLGFPVYRYSTNNPRTIIQPDTMPGQCWAFKGSQGYIVVQLAGPVMPTGFTLEHIPKSLSPNGAIDSAPHEFEVWGLNSENDEGVFLGIYEYEEGGDPLQYFPVTAENDQHFSLIELKINSNHGNLQYTCLYRFRVHGLRLL